MSKQTGAGSNESQLILQHWNDWLRRFIDSLASLDGEFGFELLDSAGAVFSAELSAQEPIASPAAQAAAAGILSAFLEPSAVVYVDPDRPRKEVEVTLRTELELIREQIDCWLAESIDSEQLGVIVEELQIKVDKANSRFSERTVGIKKKAPRMDFDDLLRAQGRDTRMAIYEIAGVISPELFAFIINAPAKDIHDHIPNEIQRESIAELYSLLHRLPGYRYDLPRGAISGALLAYDPSIGTSKATDLHIKCGGARPLFADDGTLTLALQIVAMDFLGTRLAGEQSGQALMDVLETHPMFPSLIERVMEEGEPISQLFRRAIDQDDGLSEPQREMQHFYLPNILAQWSDGSGGSIDIRHVPEHILSSYVITADTTDGVLQAACDGISEALRVSRALAAGEVVEMNATVGLGNVTLGEEIPDIKLPGMHLRRPSPFELRNAPFTNKATLILDVQTDLCFDEVITQEFRPNEDRMDALRNFSAERERLKIYGPSRVRRAAAIEDRITQVRFAMALASRQNKLIGPIWLYSALRNPLTGWGGNSIRGSDDVTSTFSSQEIDRFIAHSITKYVVGTDQLSQSLRIARRRILQAISERNDPIDSFIDFVIAWESLVGSSENTSYVVAASMSMLLAPENVERRKSLFTRIRKLYTNRSGLVHGTVGHGVENESFKTFRLADVRTYADESGKLAIDTFKRVLRRPELMTLSAQQRSKMILIGFI